MKIIYWAFLWVLLTFSSQIIAQTKSIYTLSENLTKTKEFVTQGSETVTLLSEKKRSLSKSVILYYRHLVYEDKADKISFNYESILIKKSDKILYTSEEEYHPSYEIISINKHKKILIVLGLSNRYFPIDIFSFQNNNLTQIDHYDSEAADFIDMDHDGIHELIIASSGYLIPKGSLADAAGIWLVLKYDNRPKHIHKFKYSAQLTQLKNKDKLRLSDIICDLQNKNSVENCTKVVNNIMLNFEINHFDAMAKTIQHNMLFINADAKINFIKNFVERFFIGNSNALREKIINNLITKTLK